MNEERKNNIYIKVWKNTLDWVLTANELMYESNGQLYTQDKKSNDIRELASKQLKILDEARPNKEKSMYSQANEQQRQYIDYLEQVILYGNLEGKDNVNIRDNTL